MQAIFIWSDFFPTDMSFPQDGISEDSAMYPAGRILFRFLLERNKRLLFAQTERYLSLGTTVLASVIYPTGMT